jgi:hypothetical protein
LDGGKARSEVRTEAWRILIANISSDLIDKNKLSKNHLLQISQGKHPTKTRQGLDGESEARPISLTLLPDSSGYLIEA